jgi:hypothetical protein
MLLAALWMGMLVGQAVVSFETGHYISLDNRSCALPGVPNSQWRMLAACQRQLARELTVTFHGYMEIMQQYETYLRSFPAGSRRLRLWQFLCRTLAECPTEVSRQGMAFGQGAFREMVAGAHRLQEILARLDR